MNYYFELILNRLPTLYIFTLVVATFVFFVYVLWFVYQKFKPKHHRKIKQSKKIISKLKQFQHDGAVLTYLRKIDPYVFEEVVLSAIENLGYDIKRSQSYSGDGGVDGSFFVDGKQIYIQSKRYKSHINLQHVKDFVSVCESHHVNGIFCHTGRTGKRSRYCANDNQIKMISGEILVKLIKGIDILYTLKLNNQFPTTCFSKSQMVN